MLPCIDRFTEAEIFWDKIKKAEKMRPDVEEQLEIIRRVIERAKNLMFKNGDEKYIDIMNHLEDEYQTLKAMVE